MNGNSRVHLSLVLLAGLIAAAVACSSKQVGSDVAASVDGRNIYLAELEKYYQNQTSGSEQQPTGEQATSLRLSILRELIDNQILMRRAEKLGLLATDEDSPLRSQPVPIDSLEIDETYGAGVCGWTDTGAVSTAAGESIGAAAGIDIPKAGFVAWMLGAYLVVLVPGHPNYETADRLVGP